MKEVTRILSAIDQGESHAAEQLLPLVYDELRRLAAAQMACERPGQTLNATALVHEAYLRLVAGPDAATSSEPRWQDRQHFVAAAAAAMRHILVDNARRKRRPKHGGGRLRFPLDEAVPAPPTAAEELLALDEALGKLATQDPEAAQVVQLRYFTGLSVAEAAKALGISRARAYRHWTFARAWLLQELCGDESAPE
jgi:RNA polymerase sigma factor (TIGR02999 family)